MANITTEIAISPLRDACARFFTGLARRYEGHMHVRSRRDQIEALEAKSDDELARMGIRRDEIACHVFRDKFYT